MNLTPAATVAVLKALTDRVKAADSEARTALAASMRPGERTPADFGDTQIAWLTLTKPKPAAVTARVTDPAALLRWCREHRPGAVTETVRVTDQTVLLAEAKALAETDGEMGERIPGIVVEVGSPASPQLRVVLEPGAEDVIAAAVTSGAVPLGELTGGAA